MLRVIALFASLTLPLQALAGDVAVSLRTAQGKPIADAVVTLAAPRQGPIRFAWPYRMAQQNLQFDPFVLVVPAGADVAFPNLDKVRHHVYSFSAAKSFELKLYGRDETRVVRFDKPGVVPLGCNIHDSMVAFIVVVDTPFAAKTDAAGQAILSGAPAGASALRIWHPYLRAPDNALTATVTVPKDGVVRETLVGDLRPPPEQRRAY
jgi:plastocyanin